MIRLKFQRNVLSGGKPTEVRCVNDVSSLYCVNEECPAKHVKRFSLFVSRDAFNIEGMSEATLEKFIQSGFLRRAGRYVPFG